MSYCSFCLTTEFSRLNTVSQSTESVHFSIFVHDFFYMSSLFSRLTIFDQSTNHFRPVDRPEPNYHILKRHFHSAKGCDPSLNGNGYFFWSELFTNGSNPLSTINTCSQTLHIHRKIILTILYSSCALILAFKQQTSILLLWIFK